MTIRDGDYTLVDYDYASGRSVWSLFDGEKTVYRIDYPVAQTLEQNAIARSSTPSGWKGDWHRVASIPLNMVHDSGLSEAISGKDDKFVSKLLNDSDYRGFRTKEGVV